MRNLIASLLLSAAPASGALPSRLSLAADSVRLSLARECLITLEAFQSLPLPVRGEKGLRYRMMIYDAFGENPEDHDKKVYVPHSVAQFDATGGEATCKVSVVFPKRRQRGGVLGDQMSPATLRMSREAFVEREARFYAAVEAAAGPFAAGKKDAKAAAEFLAVFKAHSEPALAEYYRAMAPDFFEWLEGGEKK
ncbi:MAG: hypothetical protein HYZ75_11750 [Elusimicrobia bacterium]|nr:hypothetical protein [Elusimicrobiota bacterium]